MFFLDRSPGTFMVLANLVVYGVVGVEIWMWTVASVPAVVATLTLIAVCAVLICRAVLRLMDDGVPTPDTAPVPSRAAPAPAAAVVTTRKRPRQGGRMAPTA